MLQGEIIGNVLVITSNGKLCRVVDQKSSPRPLEEKDLLNWIEKKNGIYHIRHQKCLHPKSKFYISYEHNKQVYRKISNVHKVIRKAKRQPFIYKYWFRINNTAKRLRKEAEKRGKN